MIRPPGFRGAVFATAAEGDARVDEEARHRMSLTLGVSADWAFVTQVHGATSVKAKAPGRLGEADAVYTTLLGLPIAVASADCVPVIIEGAGVVAVLHVGWRGALAGVVPLTLARLTKEGLTPQRAAIGPSIGPCCYEVGEEVASRFESFAAVTDRGTTSVDIAGFVARQLEGALDQREVWRSDECTYTSTTLHSYRKTRTQDRQVAVGWLPQD